jgi:hypothetical protein
MAEEHFKVNRLYNQSVMVGCLFISILGFITLGAALIFVYRLDRHAAQYPDSVAISSHNNYSGLPRRFRWDNAYRTSDNFTSVYQWYSTMFDLGAEARANENCILLEGTRQRYRVERHTRVFLCNTPGQQLIYVARSTAFR